jgi:hypothetical protein
LRKDAVKFASSVSVGAGIFAVYFVFLARCVQLSDWASISSLEYLILATQAIRLAVVLGLGRILRIQPLFAIILFSFEAFLIPPLAVLAVLTGHQYYSSLMANTLTTWLGVSALLLSPYSIYEFAKSMVKETSLVTIMVIASLEVGGMLFLADTLAATSSIIRGPSALGTLMLELGKYQVSTSSFSGLVSNDIAALGLATIYVGMMVYVAIGVPSIYSKIRISDRFFLVLCGTALTIVWAFAVYSISSDILFVFTVPCVVGVAFLWGSSREL